MKKLLAVALILVSFPSLAQVQRITDVSNTNVTVDGTTDSVADWLSLLYNTGGPNTVESVTGSTYTILATDAGKTKVFHSAATPAGVTLPAATSTGFGEGFAVRLENANNAGGYPRITPTTSTIAGKTYWDIMPNSSIIVTSDGTNYSITDQSGGIVYPQADTTAGGSTGVGSGALRALMNTATTASYSNTAVGRLALRDSIAADNTAVGSLSGYKITTGKENVGIGRSSLFNLQSGNRNIGIGYQSLYSATGGNSNIAIGAYAMGGGSAIGDLNIAIGDAAGTPTGSQNVALGYAVVAGPGDYNIFVGAQAGAGLTSGDSNVVIGRRAGYSTTQRTGSNNILIGALVNATATTTSNFINIGNAIAGSRNAPTISACGTSAAIATGGNDINGTVTVGTGATGCVVTFNVAKGNSAACVVTSRAGSAFTYTTSNTALTLTNGDDLSSTVFDYFCSGY